FGLIAEREQRFAATGRLPRPGDLQHLVRCQIGALSLSRRMRESTIMTDVATELRQGNEDFTREGYHISMDKIPPRSRSTHHRAEIGVHKRMGGGDITVATNSEHCHRGRYHSV